MSFSQKLIKPLLIVFFVGYLLTLIVSRAPAELAVSAIHKAVPNLWLTGVQGTVWKGVAKGAQLDLAKSSVPLGSLRWQLNGWSLLLLRPCIEFKMSDGAAIISGEACQSVGGVTTLSDVSVDAPVAPISDVINLPIVGQASLSIISAELNNGYVNALDGRLSWMNGSLNPGEGWIALGSYGATLSENDNGRVKAEIFDIEAPLKVNLVATVSTTAWEFSGNVMPQDDAPELLVSGIQLFGEEVEPGTYSVILSSD